ncbi:MAG TPA: hypothetical protein VE093_03950 [Polyangiaceae bacterium]|jgi:hypothetical protein|nr:hypothetical protein [Polyangiaceae bacterium]
MKVRKSTPSEHIDPVSSDGATNRVAGHDSGEALEERVHARARAYSFVQLVFESGAIVAGRIGVSPSASVTVSVEEAFPTGLPSRIELVTPPRAEVSFRNAEQVVLFLQDVQSPWGALLGTGDVSKWPRERPNWLFTAGHVESQPRTLAVVRTLLEIDRLSTYEERTTDMLVKLVPMGTLGQIAALQYAAYTVRWAHVKSQGAVDERTMRWLLASAVLVPPRALDPAVEYAMLELLASAPPSVAIPHLIRRLNASDAAVRDSAFAALQTVALPFTPDTFGYNPHGPDAARAASIHRWETWWTSERNERVKHDVPLLLADLQAAHPLRRMAADRALRVVTGADVGYEAEAPDAERRAGAARWRALWKSRSAP